LKRAAPCCGALTLLHLQIPAAAAEAVKNIELSTSLKMMELSGGCQLGYMIFLKQ